MFLTREFDKNIPVPIKKALSLCTETADEKGLPVFLIGGIVRDIIIGQINFDVDITVQGNGIEFARALQESYPNVCTVKETHEDFKTAKVICDIESKKVHLDIASTRKESYPYPSSLPVLEEIGCNLYEDVVRRDFTINSMALSLNSANFCELIDYLGGHDDLKQGKIKILHPQSFVDDPTRIIRALKFSVRFGYEYERETQKLMQECLASGRFDNLAGERVKQELKQAFNTNIAACFERFLTEGIYRLVSASLVVPDDVACLAARCSETVETHRDFLQNQDNIWLIYLGILLAEASQEKISELSQKLYLSGAEESVLQTASKLCRSEKAITETSSRFEIYEFFEKSEVESILTFLIKNQSLKQAIGLFLEELKEIKININGNFLINLGLTPGPQFSKILRKVLKARINKEITSSEEETIFAEKLLKNYLQMPDR